MKLFTIITIARQIDGEYFFVKGEGVFKDKDQADKLVRELKQKYASSDGQIIPMKIKLDTGEIACSCEVGVLELELNE